jgi:hypothetical protein
MKCKDCPLFYEIVSSTQDGTEYDIECAAGEYFGWTTKFDCGGEGGCTRTNKWILAQNKDDLINKRMMEDAEGWELYTIQGKVNDRRAIEQGWVESPTGRFFTKGDKTVDSLYIDQHIENPAGYKEIKRMVKKGLISLEDCM